MAISRLQRITLKAANGNSPTNSQRKGGDPLLSNMHLVSYYEDDMLPFLPRFFDIPWFNQVWECMRLNFFTAMSAETALVLILPTSKKLIRKVFIYDAGFLTTNECRKLC
jgi:hypothetical protein